MGQRKQSLIAKSGANDLAIEGAQLTPVGISFAGELDSAAWERLGEFLSRAEGAVQWWIGDWLLYGEGRPEWGDKYEKAIQAFGKEYQTLADYKAVAAAYPPERGKFSLRNENLAWNHHRAVAWEPLEIRSELLEQAETEGLSVAKLRKAQQQAKRSQGTPALPPGKYRVLYADPPWKYRDERTGGVESGAASAQYDLMDTEQICALASGGRCVQELPAKDAVLFLWGTAPCLPDALRVIAAWGFTYKAQFVWNKVRGYNGHYNDVQHELLLIGVRGSCQPSEGPLRDSIVTAEKAQHSAKPEIFREIIEGMYPLARQSHVELFARGACPGWVAWGKEANTTATTET